MTCQFGKVTSFSLYQVYMCKQILAIHFFREITQSVRFFIEVG